jgi:broad specificity phosphatase PhoE
MASTYFARRIELVFVRHAQPHWHPGGSTATDPGLTTEGVQSARRLSEHLGHVDALHVSPARRCQETADILFADSRVVRTNEPWMLEQRTANFEGQPEHLVKRYFDSLVNRPLEEWQHGFPAGEPFVDFRSRVVFSLEILLKKRYGIERESPEQPLWVLPREHSGLRIVFVGHEGSNALMVSSLLHVDLVPWSIVRFPMDWCRVTTLTCTRLAGHATWALSSHNQVIVR